MYELCGKYNGDVAYLEALAEAFVYKWAPQGYWIVDGREHPVEKALGPLVYDLMPAPWAFTMITKLTQRDMIPPHNDKPLPVGVTRRHLIIATNDNSWCMHGGTWQQMQAGEVYTMEPQYVHAAINWGATPRIHLVVDTGVE